MELTVLAVPDCPNAPVLEARLAQVLADQPDARIIRHIVADEQQAAHWGMHGSPTLLVNGVDPFTTADTPTSLSCRLYRSPEGTAPTTAQLRQALDHRHG